LKHPRWRENFLQGRPTFLMDHPGSLFLAWLRNQLLTSTDRRPDLILFLQTLYESWSHPVLKCDQSLYHSQNIGHVFNLFGQLTQVYRSFRFVIIKTLYPIRIDSTRIYIRSYYCYTPSLFSYMFDQENKEPKLFVFCKSQLYKSYVRGLITPWYIGMAPTISRVVWT